MNKTAMLGVLAFLLLPLATASAGEGKFSGYMFGDYFWVAQHHQEGSTNVDGHKNMHGTQFRRIYFTYDYTFDSNWATRLRFEMVQSDWETAQSKMTPAVKDAYLQYKTGNHKAYFGLYGTPTWGLVEKFWGYRSIEKTPLDLQGWASSRDRGFAFKGSFNDDKTLGYHVAYGDNESNSSLVNKADKRFYLSLNAKPAEGFITEAYFDYVPRANAVGGDPEVASKNSTQWTGQLFAGYKGDWGRVGLQYAHQYRGGDNVGPSMPPYMQIDLVSAFAVAKLGDSFNAFARGDFILYPDHKSGIDYIGNGTSKSKSQFFVFGVDKGYADGKVHVMPNVEIMTFGASRATEGANTDNSADGKVGVGETAKSIVIPRVTFYWKFK